MAAPVEVSRVVVSQDFEVVAYADPPATQLKYQIESSTQTFVITVEDARTLCEMRNERR